LPFQVLLAFVWWRIMATPRPRQHHTRNGVLGNFVPQNHMEYCRD
jgi:hypothetical protein